MIYFLRSITQIDLDNDAGRRHPLSAHEFVIQTMQRVTLAACLAFTLLALGACGSSTTDRALSGGGIGAGVGALGGLVVGHPVEGALIGGAVGAGTGALTNEDDINLGKPIWR